MAAIAVALVIAALAAAVAYAAPKLYWYHAQVKLIAQQNQTNQDSIAYAREALKANPEAIVSAKGVGGYL